MKIIQIADLHINEHTDIDFAKRIISSVYNSIYNKLNKSEQLVVVVCGDIVNEGNANYYNISSAIINEFKNKFSDYEISFEFCPGNHDICITSGKKGFDGFNSFTNSVVKSYEEYTLECSIITKIYDELDFILINTSYSCDHTIGSYNKQQLEEKLKLLDSKKPKVMVMHHTILSEYDNDHSSIHNAYDLINIAQNNNCSAILHGHTHGLSELTVGENKCKIIGVAPFLKKQYLINIQFNLIDVLDGKIIVVENFKYSDDAILNGSRGGFEGKQYFYSDFPNIFRGNSIKSIYDSIVNRVKRYKVIYNLSISNTCKSTDFINEIELHFKEYIPKASQWQSPDCPDNIYFNHGMFLKYYDKDSKTQMSGIDYIVKELTRKKTSSRAIIPLINITNVSNVDEDQFLPSLILIQCGFESMNSNKLLFTMYLRALEVSEFLKINLCEIYLVLKKILEKIPVEEIQFELHAFRAQYIENFNCFEKSKIDKLSMADISGYIYRNEIPTIIDILREKLSKSETVVITQGILNLYECIKEYIKNHHNNDSFFSHIILDFEKLVSTIKEFENKRKLTSLYTDIEDSENSIKNLLDLIINNMEKSYNLDEKEESHGKY